jgi:putative oxidoreductase
MSIGTTLASHGHTSSKAWNIVLWLSQIVLAAMFGMAGSMKTFQPITELAQMLPWAGDVPPELVRFIGISELAAAVGLILPAATRVAPRLTPLAALGLMLVMVLAAAFHLKRGEFGALPFNIGLGALAGVVLWGRLYKAPIAPR